MWAGLCRRVLVAIGRFIRGDFNSEFLKMRVGRASRYYYYVCTERLFFSKAFCLYNSQEVLCHIPAELRLSEKKM